MTKKELADCFPIDFSRSHEATKEELLSMLRASQIRKEIQVQKEKQQNTKIY